MTGHLFYSQDKKWCYQISVIDYLQTYDRSKKMEVLAKRVFKNVNVKKLSAVPPDPYGARFIEFMKNSVFEKPMDRDSDNVLKRMISQAIFEQFRKINKLQLTAMGKKIMSQDHDKEETITNKENKN